MALKLVKVFMKFIPRSYLSKQARRPNGWFGRLIMIPMFEAGNARLLEYMLDQHKPAKSDVVCDLGFGPGQLFESLCSNAEAVIGVDFSEAMVSNAEIRYSKLISEGRLTLNEGSITMLPLDSDSLDILYTANTLYFWPDPDVDIKEVLRVLKPGGKVVIGFRDKKQLASLSLDPTVFMSYSTDEVKALLINSGYDNVTISEREEDVFNSFIAVGVKPSLFK
jgi:arsenite methyltransferase